ncbi:hypothetical protein SLE2022_141800 [Rubroshorea leprosula]
MTNEKNQNTKNIDSISVQVQDSPERERKCIYHFFFSNALYLILVLLLSITLTHPATFSVPYIIHLSLHLRFNFMTIYFFLTATVLSATPYFLGGSRKVYLVNYACYKPEPDQMCSKEMYMHFAAATRAFTEESLALQKKILERSGLGNKTYAPKALLEIPARRSVVEARKETETVMFAVIDELLKKTGVNPGDIQILVVNSSVFNPVPSLSAAVVNHFKLRGNILSYNLGGMGCSAGLISLSLANDLLQVNGNSYALVVSTENINTGWYVGNNASMLLANCLFRTGGAAVLLSNRSSDHGRSKYQIVHTLRTHTGADDQSYNCIFQEEDEKGEVGVKLRRELIAVAGEALKANITLLGRMVLPLSEQLLFLATSIARKVLKMNVNPYIPDFKLAFEHFCIHTGGKAVLDKVQKSLDLTDRHMEPSRMTLYRFGNTSSSSVWYELAYSEAKGRIQKGDRIWQIGFGSGFKCNSAVLRALRNIDPTKQEINPWIDEIDEFPVSG